MREPVEFSNNHRIYFPAIYQTQQALHAGMVQSVHVIAAILYVILNHEDEHIVGALAGRDLQRNKTVIFT